MPATEPEAEMLMYVCVVVRLYETLSVEPTGGWSDRLPKNISTSEQVCTVPNIRSS